MADPDPIEALLTEIEERHQKTRLSRDDDGPGWEGCAECGFIPIQVWPCDATRLIAALRVSMEPLPRFADRPARILAALRGEKP